MCRNLIIESNNTVLTGMPRGFRMCLNERKWFSFRSSPYYAIVKLLPPRTHPFLKDVQQCVTFAERIQRNKDSQVLGYFYVSPFCYMLAHSNILWLVQVIMIGLIFCSCFQIPTYTGLLLQKLFKPSFS